MGRDDLRVVTPKNPDLRFTHFCEERYGALCFFLLEEPKERIQEENNGDGNRIQKVSHGKRRHILEERENNRKCKRDKEDVDEDAIELPQEEEQQRSPLAREFIRSKCRQPLCGFGIGKPLAECAKFDHDIIDCLYCVHLQYYTINADSHHTDRRCVSCRTASGDACANFVLRYSYHRHPQRVGSR